MKRAFYIALREARSYVTDKGDLALSLLLPILIFALVYGAFGRQDFHSTAHIVNDDPGGKYSTLLLQRLGSSSSLDIEMLSLQEADKKLRRSDLLMVLYIPQGFSDKLSAGEQAKLVFKQRGNGGQDGQIVAGMIRGTVEEIGQDIQAHSQVSKALSGENIPQGRIDTTVQKFIDRDRENPVVKVNEETAGTDTDPARLFLPGIVSMFMLFSVSLTARSVVEERIRGTLERLLTTRLNIGQLFIGKFFSSSLRGFIQSLILLVLAWVVFGFFTPLSFLETLAVALIFAMAASAVGLIIASIVRTEEQATWIAVFFTMAMVMLAGTFYAIPEGTTLATISKFSINTHANDAMRTLINGGHISDIWQQLAILAGVIILGLSISRLVFRATPRGKGR